MRVAINFLQKSIASIKGLFARPRYKAVHTHTMPDQLDPRKVYLIGQPSSPWLAVMLCPGGCGSTLHMNLRKSQRPCWVVSINEKNCASFHPSLWKKDGCQCHFFLRNGVVQWVKP